MNRTYWAAMNGQLYRFQSAELRDLWVYDRVPTHGPLSGLPTTPAARGARPVPSASAAVQRARRALRGFYVTGPVPAPWLYSEPNYIPELDRFIS